MLGNIQRLAAAMLVCIALPGSAGCDRARLDTDAGPAGDGNTTSCGAPTCYSVVASKLLDGRNLDLLFVIDNSGSMQEEQLNLAANFNRFISVLQNIDGGLPSLHIGIVSTDMGAGAYSIPGCQDGGDGGSLQSMPRAGTCEGPQGAFISDIANDDGTRTRNYNGTLSDAFACIAPLGTNGCGFEQPLESMYRALDGSNPVNAGFLRDNANLGVVFITDEDDCSASDTAMYDPEQTTPDSPLGPLSSFRCFEFGVQCDGPENPREPGPRQNCQPRADSPYMDLPERYAEFLRSLKPSPNQIMVAGIIGDPTPVEVTQVPETGYPELAPSCTSAAGSAVPGVRLQAFLQSFPFRHLSSSICNEDFSNILASLGNLFTRWLDSACLIGPVLDTDAAAPGLQHECTVRQVVLGAPEAEIPECDNPADPLGSSNLPCHLITENREQCSTTESGLLVTLYPGNEPIPPGARADVTCVVE